MKYIFVITFLFAFAVAQDAVAQDKKQPSKIDTVTVIAKIPSVIEKNMQERDQRVANLKNEITALQKQNQDDYKAILEFNAVDEKLIIGQPEYKPGQLTFKLKPK